MKNKTKLSLAMLCGLLAFSPSSKVKADNPAIPKNNEVEMPLVAGGMYFDEMRPYPKLPERNDMAGGPRYLEVPPQPVEPPQPLPVGITVAPPPQPEPQEPYPPKMGEFMAPPVENKPSNTAPCASGEMVAPPEINKTPKEPPLAGKIAPPPASETKKKNKRKK